jgi:hypothetical protein
VVVVDLGGGLAVVRAQDAVGVPDEASLLGDGRGEEEGVQRGAVESFPGVRAGRDIQQGRPVRLRLEAGECGGQCFGTLVRADGQASPRGAAIFLDYQPTEPSRRTASTTVSLCALSGAPMLAPDGCASGRVNRTCCFRAVWVPGEAGERRRRWFDVGQLTDVRVARLAGHTNLPM